MKMSRIMSMFSRIATACTVTKSIVRGWPLVSRRFPQNRPFGPWFLSIFAASVLSQLSVVSSHGKDAASVQIAPHSCGEVIPFVESWDEMARRGSSKLAEQSTALRIEEAPLRIPEGPDRTAAEKDAPPHAAPAGLEPVTEAPQAVGTSFIGIALQDQFSAFGGGSIPPDTMGAVGPDHFVEVINSSVAVYNRIGTRLSHVSLDSFFTASIGGTTYPRNGSFDPRVLFDRRSGRWFAITLERGSTSGTYNHVILAVSASSDPTGSWYKYLVEVGVPSGTYTYFTDYDTLGTDDNGVYVAVRIFPSTGGGSSYAKIAAMQKTPLLSGTASTVYSWTSITDMYSTPQPVHNLDAVAAGDRAWFVASSSSVYANLNYRRLIWSGGVPSLDDSASAMTTPDFSAVLNAPALGSGVAINNGDMRLQMATIRNNRLWTCRNVGLNSSGGASGADRTGCEWLELNVSGSTATLVQSGRVYDSAASDPRYYYYPSIMVSGQGHAAMGFSGSKSTEYVGAYFTGRLSGDASGTMGSIALVKAGEASYQWTDGSGRNRWGDYSYTSLDPNDDMSLWTIQE
ncbi:MAG: hypothetical protein E4H00_09190, partial [Myxococcales bacterium]